MLNHFFAPVSRIQNNWPNAFDDFFDYPKYLSPSVDVHEYSDKFVIDADLPGVDEKDLKISVDGNQLVLEATRTISEEKDEKRSTLVRERHTTSFKRVFALGDLIQSDKIEASYKNGTLTIHVPKAEKAMPRVIPINKS